MQKTKNIEVIKEIASRHGYTCTHHNRPRLIVCKKQNKTVNIWYTKMTVGTAIYHNKYKKVRHLYRRDVDLSLLNEIFANPRVHTGKGYFQRRKNDIKTGNSTVFPEIETKTDIGIIKKIPKQIKIEPENSNVMPEKLSAGKPAKKRSLFTKILVFLFGDSA